MRNARTFVLLACLQLVAFVASGEQAAIASPGSTALVEDAAQWNGEVIQFTGEAIGEAMRRGGMAWIHLNDDAYGLAEAGSNPGLAGFNGGIGVWVDAALASRIASFGASGRHGDLVEVTGTFHAACPEHGGDMDIHAASLGIGRPGYTAVPPIRPSRMIAAGILAALTLALFLVNRRTDRHSGVVGPPSGRGRIRPPLRDTLGA